MPSSPPPVASIILGFGDYGWRVMNSLLRSTAERGGLRWREAPGAVPVDGRRLQDVELIWVPDVGQDAVTSSNSEALKELSDQIRRVRRVETQELHESTAQVVDAAVQRLMEDSQARPDAQGQFTPLDLHVLMAPRSVEDMGRLSVALGQALNGLVRHPTLAPRGGNARLFHCTLCLDFDGYWQDARGPSPVAMALRHQTARTLRQFEERYQNTGAGFSRVYLFDRNRTSGQMSAPERVAEVALWLEVLLFDGIRDHFSLRYLVERAEQTESPLGAIGIRMAERSSGLIQRLAAARFAAAWLAWARTGGLRSPGEHHPVEDRLQALASPPEQEEAAFAVLRESLLAEVERSLDPVARRLGELSPERDWPGAVEAVWEQQVDGLRGELLREAAVIQQDQAKARRLDRSAAVQVAVAALLHDPRAPAPLDAVVLGMREMVGRASPAARPVARAAPMVPDFAPFRAVSAEYRAYLAETVQVGRQSGWWWLYTLIVGLVATAVVRLVWTELGAALGALHPLGRAFQSLSTASMSYLPGRVGVFGAMAALAAGLLLIGPLAAAVFRRGVPRQVAWSRAWFTHPERGRHAAVITAAMQPGGSLRAPLEREVERFVNEARSARAQEDSAALASLVARLEERQRELLWLESQLGEMLMANGFDRSVGQLRRSTEGEVRASLEQQGDLDAFAAVVPLEPARYAEVQSGMAPFAAWWARWNSPFLSPLRFLDALVAAHFPANILEGRRPQEEAAEQADRIREFLSRRAGCPLGFRWPQPDQEGEGERWALLAGDWRSRVPRMRSLLLEHVREQQVVETRASERLVILRVRRAVSLDTLGGAVEGAAP